MTREEAIELIGRMSMAFVPTDQYGDYADPEPYEEAVNMAIEALQFAEHFDLLKEFQSLQEVVWCNDCKYQGKCEQIVVFDIHVDNVQGHRIDFCSYGERREDGEA